MYQNTIVEKVTKEDPQAKLWPPSAHAHMCIHTETCSLPLSSRIETVNSQGWERRRLQSFRQALGTSVEGEVCLQQSYPPEPQQTPTLQKIPIFL